MSPQTRTKGQDVGTQLRCCVPGVTVGRGEGSRWGKQGEKDDGNPPGWSQPVPIVADRSEAAGDAE